MRQSASNDSRGQPVCSGDSARQAIWPLLLVIVLAGPRPVSAQDPWQPPHGPQCFERWIGEFSRILNQYDGTREFNRRKPWHVNRYGLFMAKGFESNYEPDDWVLHGANRYQWMWGHYKSERQWPAWNNRNFANARLPGLRYFVRACIESAGGAVGAGSRTTSGTGTGGTPAPGPACPTIPVDGTGNCPATFSAFSGTRWPVGCYCPPSAINGRVWGTAVYTADSSICAAARHAGAIDETGGPVWIQGAQGLPNYQGTSRNGITTGNYGAYKGSFRFPTAGTVTPASPTLAACPPNAKDMRGRIGATHECHCATDAMDETVWGTDLYTDDSSICTAALHAGVVSKQGGPVQYTIRAGQERYPGTTRNGVTTTRYGRWSGSFSF